MNIWIDLANSPQVLFFRPILTEMECRGHHLFITSRDYAQTQALADEYQISHTLIGKHGGKKWVSIIKRNLGRTIELNRWIKTQPKIDLAVSHNSYTQALSAMLMGIPFVTLMDYEYQPLNHLCFRAAKKVIVPQPFPDDMLRKFGALHKSKKYPGLKEEIYLADFRPDPDFLEKEGFDSSKVMVVVRPPAPWTSYHRFENTLFEDVLQYLSGFKNTLIVFLPRIAAQGEWVRQLNIPNLMVPAKTLNGPNLLYYADVVISGGGTMNREASVLGVPTYTIYKGKMGAVDTHLINLGHMTQISELDDFSKIRVVKKTDHLNRKLSIDVIGSVVDLITNS